MKTRNFICSSLASKVDPGNILRFSNFLASNPNIDLVNLDFRNYHTIDELYIGVAEDNSTGPILFHFLYDPATHIANNAFTTETIRSISDLIKSRNADSKFNIYVTSTNWFLALSSAAIDNTLALIKGSDVALFTDEIMQKSFMQVADTSLIEASLANRIKNSIIVNLESSQPEREITINPHFMYEEREILTAAHGLIKKHGLKFSGRDGSGVVLDAQDNIQVSHGRVNTVAHTLVIGMSESADASNSNLIIDALSRAVDLDVPTNKHRILFPVHIFNQRHFCLAALYLNVDRSRPGEIEPEVELHIIESISGPSCEQSVGSMLHAVFKEHIKFPIKLKTCTFTARLQPDGVSCGVIVAHRIETLVLSNSFDEGGTYTADNILVMRARQIDAVNDEAFTQRQFQIIPDAKLSEPTHIHDYHAFSTKLENYLQTVESDERERFYDIALIFVICELNMLRLSFSESSQNVEKITLVRDKLSRAQQLLRNRSDPELKFALTTLSAGIAAEKSKQYLAEIREWFDYHEEPLCGVAYDRLLDCFFETHRGSDDALIWTDNGVHALYNVLEIKFDLHLIEAKPPSLHASMSLNSAGLSYDEIIDDTKTYLYRGTTDINCRATGIGFESTEHAKYVGFFDQNKKTMKGVDENFVSDINTKLYFYGARDLKGKYYNGCIRGLVGDIIPGSKATRLIFDGKIRAGKIYGIGTLEVYYIPSTGKPAFTMLAEFKNNQIVRIIETDMLGVDSPRQRVITQFVMHCNHLSIFADPTEEQSQEELKRLKLAMYYADSEISESLPLSYSSAHTASFDHTPLTSDVAAVGSFLPSYDDINKRARFEPQSSTSAITQPPIAARPENFDEWIKNKFGNLT